MHARSWTETLGRQFYRSSLDGLRDEEEIKGHRRPCIGALPGKLGKAINVSYWQPIRSYRA